MGIFTLALFLRVQPLPSLPSYAKVRELKLIDFGPGDSVLPATPSFDPTTFKLRELRRPDPDDPHG